MPARSCQHKYRFIVRLCRIDAVSVGEIQQCPRLADTAFGIKRLYRPEHGAEIRAAPAQNFHLIRVALPLLPAGNQRRVLQAAVALKKDHLHFPEKVLPGAQNGVGLLKKPADQLPAAGGGGVNGDGQRVQTPDLLVFQRLHQGQVAVALHAQMVVDIVKALLVGFQLFPGEGVAPQKFSKVIQRLVQRKGGILSAAGKAAPAALPQLSAAGENAFPPGFQRVG